MIDNQVYPNVQPGSFHLGDLIDALENCGRLRWTLPYGFTQPHSYRGFYEDVAFVLTRDVTVQECLDAAKAAVDSNYEGWKGGNYTMDRWSDCWLVPREGAEGETIGRLLITLMLHGAHTEPPTTVCTCAPSKPGAEFTGCEKHSTQNSYVSSPEAVT